MTLGVLLRTFADRVGVAAPPIDSVADTMNVSGVAYDSRQARAGSVFVALKGEKADGSLFARDAIAKGAVAVLAETPTLPSGA